MHRILVAALSIAVLGATSAHGQAATATVTGEVRDVSTNAPIAGAVVAFPAIERSALTDQEGQFRITLPAGTYLWVVTSLGYAELVEESILADGDHFRIGLMPSPIELEPVVVDAESIEETFEYRKRAAAVSMQPLTPREVAQSGAANLEEFAKSRLGLVLCPATGTAANPAAGAFTTALAESMAGFQGCIAMRGRVLPVAVYINDNFALGGLIELATYQPHEVYTIEVWRRGAEIRLFTNDYIEKVSLGRAPLHRVPLPPPGG